MISAKAVFERLANEIAYAFIILDADKISGLPKRIAEQYAGAEIALNIGVGLAHPVEVWVHPDKITLTGLVFAGMPAEVEAPWDSISRLLVYTNVADLSNKANPNAMFNFTGVRSQPEPAKKPKLRAVK